MPPDNELASPASHDRNVYGKNEEADRDHPKADNRQEADKTKGHKQNADADANRLRLRQMKVALGKPDLGTSHAVAGWGLDLWRGLPHIGMHRAGRKLGGMPRRRGAEEPLKARWLLL